MLKDSLQTKKASWSIKYQEALISLDIYLEISSCSPDFALYVNKYPLFRAKSASYTLTQHQ